MAGVSRNDPCPCGSGKKFKHCHLQQGIGPLRPGPVAAPRGAAAANLMREADNQHRAGRSEQAEALYRQILALDPVNAEALHALGVIAFQRGESEAAVGYLGKAVGTRPSTKMLYHFAVALERVGRLEEAAEVYRRVLKASDSWFRFAAHVNLGNTLLAQGNIGEAVESFRGALRDAPDDPMALSNLLFALSCDPSCSPDAYLKEARRYGSSVLRRARPYSDWLIDAAVHGERPLRVGIVSGDLLTHPVGLFLENVLTHVDSRRLEFVAYSTHTDEDAFTARLKARFKEWNSLVGLNDEDAAQRIRNDQICILVDASGHTGKNRLPIFAWKPAPVEVSWIGYFASTGVPGIDYLIADEASVPDADRGNFTESIWHLPATRFCMMPPDDADELPVSAPPARRNRYITFGSFQRQLKINDSVASVWARVLGSLPDARLRVQGVGLDDPGQRERLYRRFADAGIARERLRLEPWVSRRAYLAAHEEVDLILDTFPFSGGTTTCEALWMGVPTITLMGRNMLARQGVSQLRCVGLEDWIARDEEDFVTKAVAHAQNLEGLTALRSELRQRALASPLFDGRAFTRNLETAFEKMWQAHMQRAER